MGVLDRLEKQINKANQFMSEKISGVEGTKLDDDTTQEDRPVRGAGRPSKIKTKEYLQPNLHCPC